MTLLNYLGYLLLTLPINLTVFFFMVVDGNPFKLKSHLIAQAIVLLFGNLIVLWALAIAFCLETPQ